MARKKKGDDAAETNGVATEHPPTEPQNGVATEPLPPEVTTANPPEANGSTTETNRPCKTFSCAAAAGVYVEASIWPKVIKIDDRDVTVYSTTLRKSYRREGDGTWGNTNFLRGSEIPVAVHVLSLAATWIMQQRTTEDPPF
jgi:hypothetical protein